MLKILITASIALWLQLWALGAFAQNPQLMPPDSGLIALIEEAQANNPDLISRDWQIEASRRNQIQAGILPDPMISLGMMNLPANFFDFNQEPMTAFWINGSQSIPVTSKYGLKKELAALNTENDEYARNLNELTVIETLSHNWYDWAYLNSAVDVVEEIIGLSENTLNVLQQKYETGQIPQSDVLRFEIEISRWEDKKLQFQQKALAEGQRIAVLAGRSPEEIPPIPAHLPDKFSTFSRVETQSALKSHNILLKQVRNTLDQARAETALAKAMWFPDLNLSAGYGFRQDSDTGAERPDFVSLSISSTIPIYGAKKQKQRVEESQARQKSWEAKFRSAELNLNLNLSVMLDEDERLNQQIKLYAEAIVPKAEAAYETSLTEYSVGEIGIEGLLEVEKSLLNARLQKLEYIRDRAKVRASIQSLISDASKSILSESSIEGDKR